MTFEFLCRSAHMLQRAARLGCASNKLPWAAPALTGARSTDRLCLSVCVCCAGCWCSRCVLQVYLVGDPVQLPATVISGRALEQGYDVSLFKRLQVSDASRQTDAAHRLTLLCAEPSEAHGLFSLQRPLRLSGSVNGRQSVPAALLESAALPAPMQSCGYPVNVLDVQYRMHPAISTFPSQEFYQGRLKDGEVSRQGLLATCRAGPCCGLLPPLGA